MSRQRGLGEEETELTDFLRSQIGEPSGRAERPGRVADGDFLEFVDVGPPIPESRGGKAGVVELHKVAGALGAGGLGDEVRIELEYSGRAADRSDASRRAQIFQEAMSFPSARQPDDSGRIHNQLTISPQDAPQFTQWIAGQSDVSARVVPSRTDVRAPRRQDQGQGRVPAGGSAPAGGGSAPGAGGSSRRQTFPPSTGSGFDRSSGRGSRSRAGGGSSFLTGALIVGGVALAGSLLSSSGESGGGGSDGRRQNESEEEPGQDPEQEADGKKDAAIRSAKARANAGGDDRADNGGGSTGKGESEREESSDERKNAAVRAAKARANAETEEDDQATRSKSANRKGQNKPEESSDEKKAAAINAAKSTARATAQGPEDEQEKTK